jgi:rhodanese-related sulfurtransferase
MNLYADIPESEFPIEIRGPEAKRFYDRGGLLVLDAREQVEYEEGHIRGALCAPVDDVVADLEWLDRTAADPRPIMAYCGGGDCEISLDLALEITRAGHRRVLVLLDGYGGWKEAGYPVSRGEAP